MSQHGKLDREPNRQILRRIVKFVDAGSRYRNAQVNLALVLTLIAAVSFLCLAVAGIWYLKNASPTRTVPSDSDLHSHEEANGPRPEQSWAVPNSKPVSLDYAPSDFQAVLSIRLAAISRHMEGNKIIRAMGPLMESRLDNWLRQMRLERSHVEQLKLYLVPQGSTIPRVVTIAHVGEGSLGSLPAYRSRDAKGVASNGGIDFWFPDQTTMVAGPHELINQIRSSSTRPRLRRELATLIDSSSSQAHFVAIVNPSFLMTEARGWFSGNYQHLLDQMNVFWTDHGQAVSCSLTLSEAATLQIRMMSRIDMPPRQLQAHTRRFLDRLPSDVGDYLGRVELDAYWQPLAVRFPSMVQYVVSECEVATDERQVVTTTTLPIEAIHNLLLASELTLASQLRQQAEQRVDRSQWGLSQVLAWSIDVQFEQKSLEAAFRDVVSQVREELPGVPFEISVEIVGSDLETEGITRNQQIRGFVVEQQRFADVLTAIVVRANPDQSTTGPADSNQKLVWATEGNRILITTRDAAEQKQLKLSDAFLRENEL